MIGRTYWLSDSIKMTVASGLFTFRKDLGSGYRIRKLSFNRNLDVVQNTGFSDLEIKYLKEIALQYKEVDRMLSAESVRVICIKNNWFTGGTNEQYRKLFQLIRNDAPLVHIALTIWLCSPNTDRAEIEKELRQLKLR